MSIRQPTYTTGVRRVERRDTHRRISFGDIDILKEFPSPLQNGPSDATSSPTTPPKSLKVEVDSPYTALTPEKVATLLDNDRRAPPIDHKIHGSSSTKGCDFDLLPSFICGLLSFILGIT